jgi:hypothetical protein
LEGRTISLLTDFVERKAEHSGDVIVIQQNYFRSMCRYYLGLSMSASELIDLVVQHQLNLAVCMYVPMWIVDICLLSAQGTASRVFVAYFS